MNRSERRRFREIERALESDDPAFAERLTAVGTPLVVSRAQRRFHVSMSIGALLSLVGLLVHPLLIAVGVLVVLRALVLVWLVKPPDRPDGEDPPGGISVPR